MCHHQQQTHCVNSNNTVERLHEAQLFCQQKGIKLTPLRQLVLQIIYNTKQPIGAYEILSQLSELAQKPAAPPTVHRSLDFLLSQGLIHRLSSLNAYIPCCHPRGSHQSIFYICNQCGVVQEGSTAPIAQVLQTHTHNVQFLPQQVFLEVLGLCQQCQANNPTSHLNSASVTFTHNATVTTTTNKPQEMGAATTPNAERNHV